MDENASDLQLDIILSGILQVTLGKSRSSLKLTHLADLERSMLETSNYNTEATSMLIKMSNLDAVFVETMYQNRAKLLPKMIDVYRRICGSPFRREKSVEYLNSKLIDFAVSAMTNPSLFQLADISSHPLLGTKDSLMQYLLLEEKRPSDFMKFMNELLDKAESKGATDEIVHPLLSEMIRRVEISLKRLDVKYSILSANAILHLVSHKSVALSVVRSRYWLESMEKGKMDGTLLAIFMNLPPTQGTEGYMLLEAVFSVVRKMLSFSGEVRVAVINFFSTMANHNSKCANFEYVSADTTSRNVLFNSSLIWLKLTLPFVQARKLDLVDETYTKVSRVDLHTSSSAIGFSEEERVEYVNSARNGEALRQYQDYNFVTECLYVASSLLNIGYFPLVSHLKILEGDLRRLKPMKDEISNMPRLRAVLFQKKWDELTSKKEELLSLLAVGHQSYTVSESLIQFCSFFSEWFYTMLDRQNMENKLTMDAANRDMLLLPEYMFQNIADYLIYLIGYETTLYFQSMDAIEVFFRMICYAMHPADFFTNPYIPADLLKVMEATLHVGSRPVAGGKPVVLPATEALFLGGFMKRNIVGFLLNFYVRVEKTGTATQFYDKLQIRHQITSILLYLFSLHEYLPSFRRAFQDVGFFLGFTDVILNDSVYLLDEMLEKLKEIHVLEEKFRNKDKLTDDEIELIRKDFAALQRPTPAICMLATSILELLTEFAAVVPESFVFPENVHRVADMLNYYISAMAGSKYRALRVENPEKYSFRPRDILRFIVLIYNNLARFPEFARAVVADPRSYSHRLFVQTARLIKGRKVVTLVEAERFDDFVNHLSEIKKEGDAADVEEEGEEIPDEFVDPIMLTIMDDPVTLPSGLVMDRSVISRILRTDPLDPYTRQPLSLEMLKPNLELKTRIDEYKGRKNIT